MENVKNARPDPKPTDITDMEEKQKPKYDLPELQNALDEILKELDKYKVTTKMSNEAVYWSTLVNENLPRWALVDAIKDIAAPLRIVDVTAEEELNQVTMQISNTVKRQKFGHFAVFFRYESIYLAAQCRVSF